MDTETDILSVARQYADCISMRDVDCHVEMMADNYIFIDSAGTRAGGKEHMRQGWTWYYSLFPDYIITIEDSFIRGNEVIMLGTAEGTYNVDGELRPENKWKIPAVWKAVVENGKISHWQVWADNGIVADIMRRADND